MMGDVEAPESSVGTGTGTGTAREEASRHWVTAVVHVHVPPSVSEAELRAYLRGIGAAIRPFPGYVSRKIVELPQSDDVGSSSAGSTTTDKKKKKTKTTTTAKGRTLVPLLKFSGATTEEAFRNMTRWIESDELVKWKGEAAKLGIVFDGYQKMGDAVARVEITGPNGGATKGGTIDKNKIAPSATRPPPKWKMVVLVEVWVFFLVSLHGLAGTAVALNAAFQNEPFSLLVLLACVVPVLTYAGLPLTLGVRCISHWAHQRSEYTSPSKADDAKRPSPSFCGDVIAVLEDGFGLFTPDGTVPREHEALKRRVATLERRLDLVAKRELERNSSQEKDEKASSSSLDAVRRSHAVPGFSSDDPTPSATKEEESVSEAFDDLDGEDDGGVAVAARHHVRWGARREFEAWCVEIADAMRAHGGFLGSDVFRYNNNASSAIESDASHHYVALFRFDTYERMTSWLDSDARATLLMKLEPLVDATTAYRTVGASLRILADPVPSFDRSERARRNLFGELLFAETDAHLASPRPPAIYKATILTVFGLFLVAWVIGAHLAHRMDAAFPSPFLSVFFTTLITVVGNTYVGAPFMTFFFAHWLTQHPKLQGDDDDDDATGDDDDDDKKASGSTEARGDDATSADDAEGPASSKKNKPAVKPPNPLLQFLVVGTNSTPLRLFLLLTYIAILVLATILKGG